RGRGARRGNADGEEQRCEGFLRHDVSSRAKLPRSVQLAEFSAEASKARRFRVHPGVSRPSPRIFFLAITRVEAWHGARTISGHGYRIASVQQGWNRLWIAWSAAVLLFLVGVPGAAMAGSK